MSPRSILVTGGAGYVGSILVPQMLRDGYRVTVYDTLWFGSDFLPAKDQNLRVVKGDVRDVELFANAVEDHDSVIHLACISNDSSFELDERLSTSVNLHAFKPLVMASKRAGVKRFIYASSSSVYGVSDSPDVTEDHPLVPLTLYNRYKGECEPLLLEEVDDDFVGVIVRPATLCGFAPRQRASANVRSTALRWDGGSSIPLQAREMTRRTLTSSTMDSSPNAKARMAAAVYSPTPGR